MQRAGKGLTRVVELVPHFHFHDHAPLLKQIADHYVACSGSEAWRLLDRAAMERVAAHLASRHARLLHLIQVVDQQQGGEEAVAEGAGSRDGDEGDEDL